MKINFVSSMFLIVGLILSSVAIIYIENDVQYRKTLRTTTGTVIDIFEIKDYKYNSLYYPIVQFTTDKGEIVNTHIDAEVSKTDKGRIFKIEYSVENPLQAKKHRLHFITYVLFSLFGLIFLGIGVLLMIVMSDKWSYRLKSSYTLEATANITGFKESNAVKRGIRAHYINAVYTDPVTGVEYVVRSKDYWISPEQFPPLPQTATVKMDPKNPSNNWLDTAFFDDTYLAKNLLK